MLQFELLEQYLNFHFFILARIAEVAARACLFSNLSASAVRLLKLKDNMKLLFT